jgi:hypothetical protein
MHSGADVIAVIPCLGWERYSPAGKSAEVASAA